MIVVKRDKRLFVMDGERRVYSPPDWLRVPSREPLHRLAVELAAGRGIRAIMEFEAAFHPKREARRPLPWSVSAGSSSPSPLE